MASNIEKLLNIMLEKGGSDLHIHAETFPIVRINGKLTAVEKDVLSAEDSKKLVYALLNETEIKILEKRKELDKGFSLEDKGRFRLNAFYHRGAVCAAIRSVPLTVPDFKTLGLPEEQMASICRSKSGLVLVTGATGVGKTTTLASIVDRINAERYCHIITIEDPVEVVHKNKKSIITQREVGNDTLGFGPALKYILRQDPDVILIGEMRDFETIQAALNIAETGHLVFATLHTTDCVQTINRIIDVFPGSQQSQVRTQLSYVLLATISQQLLPKTDSSGLCLAVEIMVSNFGVRTMIREDKIHQIFSMIQTGQKEGMKTMNQSLFELYREGKISYQEASLHVSDLEDFKRFFKDGR
ncbi:MAG: type IV pilus twitching motility protein PilT [Candidatus Omnitrophica bacterium]|nr:type IV pilus twitching motility protein PilT [Candidatus Omnitrophota bacterium]MCG2704127.1 type IV pilus twitching motility protein PilT [Candidatus Omnitrophota bacterium]